MLKVLQDFLRLQLQDIKLPLVLVIFKTKLVNSAVLSDQYKVISNENIQYQDINQNIKNDCVYKYIAQYKLDQLEEDPFKYLFSDYINLIEDEELNFEEKVEIIKELMVPREFDKKSIASQKIS